MKATQLKRRIREAQRLWLTAKQSGDVVGLPGFLDGVRRGFTETLRIIDACHREEVQSRREGRRPLTRWNAVLMYRACLLALRRLEVSDRAGAIKVLERVIGQVSLEGETGPKSGRR
jgi:hypothetical protein